MEQQCIFVSSRGILKSCDIYNNNIQSSDIDLDVSKYLEIKKNDIVYINTSALHNFFKNILPFVKEPFILVSGDSDVSVEEYIDNEKIIHWFAQNLLISHTKLTHIPIGLDYHTLKPNENHPWGLGSLPKEQEILLMSIKQNSNPLLERLFGCYSNFHHNVWGIGERGDRKEVVEKASRDIVYYEPYFTSREDAWKNQSKFMFVLSPKGGGVDCHRTWEALILGCIPIVKSSGLDPLYEDLPVCIVKCWSDVNKDYLINFLNTMKSYNYEKLSLNYWVNLIKSKHI
jgi:hypothetical protein